SAARPSASTAAFILRAAAIAYSNLQLRRHLFIDVVSGAVLALVAGMQVDALGRSRPVALKGNMQ
ncbi:inositol phosphorylceramide synthase, partial [Pseudomonas syringae pv. tagetis]